MPERENISTDLDSIIVIQSLPPSESQTGLRLFEDTIRPSVDRHDRFFCKYVEVESKEELLATLEEVADWSVEGNHSPLIHIEAHGCQAGLTLSNGELVEWSELRPVLTRINLFTGLRLLVVLGACHGMSIAGIMALHEPAPVWGIIGPAQNVSPAEIREYYSDFYSSFLDTFDGERALVAMNGEGNPIHGTFPFFTANTLFRLSHQFYEEEMSDTKKLRRRVEGTLKKMSLQVHERGQRRRQIRNHYTDYERIFEETKHKFFMLEKFPENVSRFNLNRLNLGEEGTDHESA